MKYGLVKSDHSHLNVFGFDTFFHIPTKNMTKLDNKAVKYISLAGVDEDIMENI